MVIKKQKKQIYEGKAKVLYEGPEPGTLIQYFKDDATAFNNKKKDVINGKGALNNRISEFIMTKLNEHNIPTHFIKRLNMREQLVKHVEVVQIEVIIRNYAAGSLCKRLNFEEGEKLISPLIEFCYKNDELDDPLISDEHIYNMRLCTPFELEEIKHHAFRINDFLSGLFTGVGIKLVDFKLEFGRLESEDSSEIILADEISPDSCRLWDIRTSKKLDKDRFRRDLGGVEEAYHEVAHRLGILADSKFITKDEDNKEPPKKKEHK